MTQRETLQAELSSAGRARRLVSTALAGHDEDLRDSAVLLVSEVVTNALIHAGTEVVLAFRVDKDSVRVEVSDYSARSPERRDAPGSATSGRGLELVELLASDWGVSTHEGGKTVWFELGTPSNSGEKAVTSTVTGRQVELKNVPSDLAAAALTHDEDALREVTLRGGAGGGLSAVQRVGLGSLHSQVLEAAAAGLTSLDLVFDVEDEGGERVLSMLALLEEADALAGEGELFVSAPSADAVAWRRSALSSIAAQLDVPVLDVPGPRRA